MSVRQQVLALARKRALEEQAERFNPIGHTGATPSMGLSQYRGGGATPSMGTSQFRGGRVRKSAKALNEIIERDEADSPSLYLKEEDDMAEMPSGEYDGAGDAHMQGAALSKHLLGLRGGAFHKAFMEGMGMSGCGMSGGAMVGAGSNTGRYEGEGRLEIVHHSEGAGRSGGAKRKSKSAASPYFDAVDGYASQVESGAKKLERGAKDIAQDAFLIKDVTKEGRIELGRTAKGGARSGGMKRIVGEGDGRRKRAAVVKRVMAEKGLSMIEASKYVKEHGLY